jgi:hypothetical protein
MTGKERNMRVLPALAAVQVHAAAGLVKESKACLTWESLLGDIERDTDRDKLSTALDSTPVSPLSRRRDLVVDALVGCSNRILTTPLMKKGMGMILLVRDKGVRVVPTRVIPSASVPDSSTL